MDQPSNILYERLFKESHDKILILKPISFEIIAVTDEYLKASNKKETELLGKEFFRALSDKPEQFGTRWLQQTLTSLQRVQSLKKTDMTVPQRCFVRLASGAIEERFCSQINNPMLDDFGEIEFIIHRVQDVTTIIQQSNESKYGHTNDVALNEIIEQSNELKQAYTKLQEHDARTSAAQRLLSIGTWEFEVNTDKLNWSTEAFDIYDFPADKEAPNLKEYFELVHPDDRQAFRSLYQSFLEENVPQIIFEHRVLARDGSVKYIKGVGERHMSLEGEVVVGYVQDITPFITAKTKLTQSERLLKLAGEKMQLGGWRVIIESEEIIWTPRTAGIHGMFAGYAPASVAKAIEHYAPESREMISKAFQLCAEKGEAFDVICQLQAPDGQRPWVRVIGEAERDNKNKLVAVQGVFQDITMLHQAQDSALEAELQRINILESISDAFFVLDKKWNFTYLNRQACFFMDRRAEQLLGKEVWTEFPEAVDSQFQKEYQLAVEKQQTARFQAFFPPLEKWFDVNAYPIPDGLAVYFRDVTREREHHQKLRLVEAALERQNDIVMITEANSLDEPHGPRIVYVNDAFERLTGFSKEEAIGRTPRMLQGSGTELKQKNNIRKALQEKKPIRCEVLNYKKSGEPYWLELDIAPLFDGEGHCTHFVAVERDISERKRQELQLAVAQERFELISRATNDVIRDWNLVSDEIWWNSSITDVFGYDLLQLEPGQISWTARIHPDDLERVLRSVQDAIEGRGEVWQTDYRFIKSNGQSAFVNDRGFLIRDGSGKAIRMVSSMLDNTARMDMEQRLRESQRLEAVGHLTGGVAHDFNNLLTVIMSYAEIMTLSLKDEDLLSMAHMMVNAAQRGAELTSRLLSFARRQPLDPSPTNLNQVAGKLRELVRRTLPEDIKLEFVTDSEPGIAIIDVSELDTALLNLVVNARDAMPKGGKLTIKIKNIVLDSRESALLSDVAPGNYVMICVIDTGSGMNADTLSKAVEPFFTTKLVGQGSGLGLSMVFGFTKQSGGHVSIESELGKGTTVKLYFPRVEGVEQSKNQFIPQQRIQTGAEHILIVEDDVLVLQQLETQLCSLGYRVSSVTSGVDALNILKAPHDIALLLTDVIMSGGMNGRELVDKAKAISPSLKVLYTSGYAGQTIKYKGRVDEDINLLRKPYTRFELAAKVRMAIEGD